MTSSRTVSFIWMLLDWVRMARRLESSLLFHLAMSRPSKSTRPASRAMSREIMPMTVDFPAPFGANEGQHLAFGYCKGDGIHHSFAVVLFCQFFYLQPLDPPSCEQQIEEIHPAAHGDEHADGDGIGVHMLHHQLARHQNHHPEQDRACDELGVAVGF